jgi:hypothetical protein
LKQAFKIIQFNFLNHSVQQPGQKSPWLLQHNDCGFQGFKIYLPATTIKDKLHQQLNTEETGLNI